MFRKWIGLVALLALIPIVLSTEKTIAQNPPPVLVRFIHAFPADSRFDVYINATLVANGLAYGEATPHLRFPAGTAQVEVRVTGSPSDSIPYVERTVNFATTSIGFGHWSFVIQTDAFNQPVIAQIEDLLSPTALGQSRLHFIHAHPQLGALSLVANGAPFLQEVGFNASIGTVDPPVGAYAFSVVSGSQTLLSLPTISLRSGFFYTVLVMPAIGGTLLEARIYQTAVFADPNTPSILVQFGHGSPNAPAFDVYLNDRLAIPSLQTGEMVPHSYYPRGEVRVSIREAGSPATIAPAHEQTLNLQSETEALTVMMLGSLQAGTFEVVIFKDDIFALGTQMARVRVINATSNGPVTLELSDDTLLSNVLAPNEIGEAVNVPFGVYGAEGIVDDVEINGPISVTLDEQPFLGGSWITLLVYTQDEPILTLTTSPVNTSANSLPLAEQPPVVVLPTATTPPTTPSPTQEVVVTQVAPPVVATTVVERLVLAEINLNPGTNLQCREYPSSLATSLGLIPSDNPDLPVFGYAGPIDAEAGETNVPVDPTAFAEPEAAESYEQIWLQVGWNSPDGVKQCWIRADFVLLTYYEPGKQTFLVSPDRLFELIVLEEPPITRIPANVAGGFTSSSLPTPAVATLPAPSTDILILGEAVLDTSILDRPALNGTELRRLPVGSTIQLLGRTADSAWVNIRYEVVGETVITGWVSVTAIGLVTPNVGLNDLPITG